MAGRPRGAWAEKQFRDALRTAVNAPAEDGRKVLLHIVDGLIEAAKEAQPWAVQEVANRLDGKPAQDINVDQTVTHELDSLSDAELAGRIKTELARLAGRGEATPDQGKLH